MKQINEHEAMTCPSCGRLFREVPAMSRKDNTTLICPDCGTREALATLGIDEQEQDEIVEIIHGHRPV